MKGQTNNPKGRPLKGEERRKAITIRITPTAADAIFKAAKSLGVSQSDIIEDYAIGILKWRLDSGYNIPDWCDRSKTQIPEKSGM